MLKFEWALIVPEDENVKRLSEAVFDIDEYVVDIAKRRACRRAATARRKA